MFGRHEPKNDAVGVSGSGSESANPAPLGAKDTGLLPVSSRAKLLRHRPAGCSLGPVRLHKSKLLAKSKADSSKSAETHRLPAPGGASLLAVAARSAPRHQVQQLPRFYRGRSAARCLRRFRLHQDAPPHQAGRWQLRRWIA